MQNSAESDGLKVLLGAQSCLILAPSKTSAANFRAALRQFGMAPGKIFAAAGIAEAESFLKVNKPTILIVDFNQDSREAFGLIERFEKVHPENARVALLAVSVGGVNVQSDGQVDGHIAKPFNLESLRRILLKTLITKFYPDAYMKKVLQADELVARGEDEPAQVEYEAARALNSKPLRVHRGLAILHQSRGRFTEALVEFQRARSFSGLDYKSVIGEFEVLLKVGDVNAAAALVPVLRDSFPMDSNRLEKLFDTVTRAGRFEELGLLLRTFRDLPERSEALIRSVQESFFVAGQAAMAKFDAASALEFFEVGFQVAARRFDFLELVVREFLKTGSREAAEQFLAKSMPEDVGSAAYRRLCFELDCLVLPVDALLERGRKLVFDDHGSPEVFSKVVALFAEAGKVTMAEAVIAKAAENFPTLRDSLYEVLDSGSRKDTFRKAA